MLFYQILLFVMNKFIFPSVSHVDIFLQSIDELEKEMLNGQKLQGPYTAAEVNHMLKAKGMEAR